MSSGRQVVFQGSQAHLHANADQLTLCHDPAIKTPSRTMEEPLRSFDDLQASPLPTADAHQVLTLWQLLQAYRALQCEHAVLL